MPESWITNHAPATERREIIFAAPRCIFHFIRLLLIPVVTTVELLCRRDYHGWVVGTPRTITCCTLSRHDLFQSTARDFDPPLCAAHTQATPFTLARGRGRGFTPRGWAVKMLLSRFSRNACQHCGHCKTINSKSNQTRQRTYTYERAIQKSQYAPGLKGARVPL